MELRILARHVLPTCSAPVVFAAGALQVGAAILLEAGLPFLGLGGRTLLRGGYLLNNAQPFSQSAWWISIFPSCTIALPVLAVNLAADGSAKPWMPACDALPHDGKRSTSGRQHDLASALAALDQAVRFRGFLQVKLRADDR
jgi:hypothetical protein